jgi:hypothetical protein
MKLNGINPNHTQRVELDGRLRALLKAAIDAEEVSVEEVVYLLVRTAVETEEFLPKGFVLGNVSGAYTLRYGMSIDDVLEQLQRFKDEMGRG